MWAVALAGAALLNTGTHASTHRETAGERAREREK